MILDRVTMTGADDSVCPEQLLDISAEYPFVEWGILVSESQTGRRRFPSRDWMRDLIHLANGLGDGWGFKLSLHICGKWVRNICKGDFSILDEVLPGGAGHKLWGCFQRVQLNFHAYEHLIDDPAFTESLRRHCDGKQVIFQCDGVNDHLASAAYDDGIDAVPLYDRSGGAGVLPGEWPNGLAGIYCGYAGGLSPENVAEQIPLIEQAAVDRRIWIDAETHVRTPDDREFDLQRVVTFLHAAHPFVTTEELPV